ncbi:MAG: hypothetical protein HPY50_01910 [Firmicutes bacterium]|nr:hypothetical protein [Bacillota bacterium]
MIDIKTLSIQRSLAILALVGAIIASYNAGNILAYTGIAYYILCIVALLMNYTRANLLLWAAVGVHVGLTSYAFWRWQALGIIPCHFCLMAAGFALAAAVVYYRPKLAVLPLALMLVVGYTWPYIFAVENNQDSRLGNQAVESIDSVKSNDQKTEVNPQEITDNNSDKEVTPTNKQPKEPSKTDTPKKNQPETSVDKTNDQPAVSDFNPKTGQVSEPATKDQGQPAVKPGDSGNEKPESVTLKPSSSG